MAIIANVNYYWNLLDQWTVAHYYNRKVWKGYYVVDRLGDALASIARPSPPNGLSSFFDSFPKDQTAGETIFWVIFGTTLAFGEIRSFFFD